MMLIINLIFIDDEIKNTILFSKIFILDYCLSTLSDVPLQLCNKTNLFLCKSEINHTQYKKHRNVVELIFKFLPFRL